MKIFSLFTQNKDTVQMTEEEKKDVWNTIAQNTFDAKIEEDNQLLGFFRSTTEKTNVTEEKYTSPFEKTKVE